MKITNASITTVITLDLTGCFFNRFAIEANITDSMDTQAKSPVSGASVTFNA